MRSRPALLVVLALLTAACASSSAPTSPRTNGATVPVLKVTDGDTIHVRYQGKDERVRLIGVNTPEVDWYGGEAQCFGDEAGRYAQGRLNAATVRLAFDVDLRDRYGRLLAYVYLGDELFNLTLVQQGYARADPVPPDTKMAAQFASAEDQAKQADRGLWSACPSG